MGQPVIIANKPKGWWAQLPPEKKLKTTYGLLIAGTMLFTSGSAVLFNELENQERKPIFYLADALVLLGYAGLGLSVKTLNDTLPDLARIYSASTDVFAVIAEKPCGGKSSKSLAKAAAIIGGAGSLSYFIGLVYENIRLYLHKDHQVNALGYLLLGAGLALIAVAGGIGLQAYRSKRWELEHPNHGSSALASLGTDPFATSYP